MSQRGGGGGGGEKKTSRSISILVTFSFLARKKKKKKKEKEKEKEEKKERKRKSIFWESSSGMPMPQRTWKSVIPMTKKKNVLNDVLHTYRDADLYIYT